MHLIILAGALVVMAGVGYFFLGTSSSDNVLEVKMPEAQNQDVGNSNTVNSQSQTQIQNNANTDVSKYKDGTYSQKGVYNSPAGSESVVVSVTLKDGVVTSSTFKGDATNKASVNNQNKFSAGFAGQVMGKPIDSISLTVVNGSSLTPVGFMDALNKIKAEAKI